MSSLVVEKDKEVESTIIPVSDALNEALSPIKWSKQADASVFSVAVDSVLVVASKSLPP